MRVEAKPCPCGQCQKWLVVPLFNSVDATLYKHEADELVRRWNAFEAPQVPTVIPNQGLPL